MAKGNDAQPKAASKFGTIVLPCDCKNAFQEREYKGKRLHNYCKGGKGARCTVCSKVKEL